MSGPRIARIAVFAALVAVFGLTPAISVPGSSVPITAQTLGVMLAGLLLVPLEAFLSLALFLGLVAAGLPLLSGGRGGLAPFTSPTAGFLIGFPIAAAAVALIAVALRRIREPTTPSGQIALGVSASLLGGVVVLYAIAIPFGAWIGGVPLGEFTRTMILFVPGDLAKAVAAAFVAAAVVRAAPFLAPQRASGNGRA